MAQRANTAADDEDSPSRAALLSVMTGRTTRRKLWTEKKRQRFLETLAATCNVQAACREVGMTDSGAYALRGRDATFRRDWRAAIAEGYARLEIEMLERALIAEERVRGALADAATDREALDMLSKHPQRVAELLYRAHRQTALEHDGAADDDPDGEKALAEIRERVDKLRERLLADDPA